MKTIGN